MAPLAFTFEAFHRVGRLPNRTIRLRRESKTDSRKIQFQSLFDFFTIEVLTMVDEFNLCVASKNLGSKPCVSLATANPPPIGLIDTDFHIFFSNKANSSMKGVGRIGHTGCRGMIDHCFNQCR